MSFIYHFKRDDLESGLEKSLDAAALLSCFLTNVLEDDDAWTLNREAFKGAAYLAHELQYALFDMLKKAKSDANPGADVNPPSVV